MENSLYVPTNDTPGTPTHLHDDWLTDEERQVKYRELQRQGRVLELRIQAETPAPVTISSISIPPFVHTHPDGTVIMPTLTKPVVKPVTSVSAPTSVTTTQVPSTRPSGIFSGPVMGPDVVVSTPTVSKPAAVLSSPGDRRTQRSTNGSFQTTKYVDEAYVASFDRLFKNTIRRLYIWLI